MAASRSRSRGCGSSTGCCTAGALRVTLVVDDAPSYRTVVVSGPAEILDDDASLRVTLVVDDAPSYRTVVVSGPAEILDDDASLLGLRARLRTKYRYDFGESSRSDDEVLRSLREEGRVVVSITPEQVLSWAGG